MKPFASLGGELHLNNPGQMELLRGMMERGVPLRTTVRGFSMTPFIRDQDVLTIAPMNGRAPCVGEVVAFVQPNSGRLAVHRVIEARDGAWLIRGDNSPERDGFIPRENILGVVMRVERDGNDVHVGLGVERAWIAVLNRGAGLMRLKQIWYAPRRTAGFALRLVQALPLYRSLGRRLTLPVETAEAGARDLAAVHRKLNPFAPYQQQPQNPNVTNLVSRRGAKVIGFVQLVYHPENHFPWVGHWLFSLHVWGPYRGLGVGETLTRRVIEQGGNRGAADLFLAVFEDNARAIRLYLKLGFSPITLPALEPEFAAEKQQSGRRRIVMRKHLVLTPCRTSGNP